MRRYCPPNRLNVSYSRCHDCGFDHDGAIGEVFLLQHSGMLLLLIHRYHFMPSCTSMADFIERQSSKGADDPLGELKDIDRLHICVTDIGFFITVTE